MILADEAIVAAYDGLTVSRNAFGSDDEEQVVLLRAIGWALLAIAAKLPSRNTDVPQAR